MKQRKYIFQLAFLVAGMLLFAGCKTNYEAAKDIGTPEAELSSEEMLTDRGDSAVYGVVDLTPYVTLGEYKGVHVQNIEAPKVTEEEVEKRIEQIMASVRGDIEEKSGPIEKGDYVVVSFQGYLDEVRIEEAKFDDMTLQVGEYLMLPDFEDGLIGAENGDIFTIEVKIPDDYEDAYAGQTLEYDVKISKVYTMNVPELTDANVKKYFDADSVKDLKQEIRQSMEKESEETARDEMNAAVMNTVIANAVINEYPGKYLEQFAKEVRQGYEEDAAVRKLTMSQYIEKMQLTEESFEKQVLDIAKANLAAEMVYQAIIQKENLTLTEEELEKGAEDYVDGSTYQSVEEVFENVDHERLEQRILYKKAYEWVIAHAVIDQ